MVKAVTTVVVPATVKVKSQVTLPFYEALKQELMRETREYFLQNYSR